MKLSCSRIHRPTRPIAAVAAFAISSICIESLSYGKTKIEANLAERPASGWMSSAPFELGHRVIGGDDITALVPVLRKYLESKDAKERTDAAMVLACHYLSKKEINELGLLLNNNDVRIREGAFEGVNICVEEERGINPPLLPIIIFRLSDPSPEVKYHATGILSGIALSQDLPFSAITELSKLLNDRNKFTRTNAARALTMHYIFKRDIKSIASLLQMRDEPARRGVASALLWSAEEGTLVSRLPALKKPENCGVIINAIESGYVLYNPTAPEVKKLIEFCKARAGK